ncbi:MAG: MBL fold metallo-hydrolase [Bryobacteraceae bacterium]|nr:MBL fold metallo-hydrolase [Bryobacteraceae bacterium]
MSRPLLTRLDLPLPWELGQVNVYLLPLDSGFLLVDCGIDSPECLAALESGLAAHNIAWRDIQIVLLTHVHPDHMGLAPEVLRRTGAALALHPIEVAHLGDILANNDGGLDVARTPQPLQDRIAREFADVRTAFAPLAPNIHLTDGQRLGPATIVHTPGHSPGHVCLALDDGALLSGDHLLENITPNIGWLPGRDTLGDFLNSLEKVAALDLATIHPAHGEPFTGHREWVRQTIAHHRERLAEIATALRLHPRTAHELVAILWPRRLSAFHYRFAVYETLSHLEYQRRRGLAVLEPDGRWASSSG